ncbi:hypothetical protein D7V97_00880 [Corallococcus sp. CA053C]|uniref:hypothetical protein n=1 Tax=Corallococcus sp. CA053C TaxID=2316732 RepID=UPI000EA27E5B|nr:hypothetical protein [Corallococcus sp. CA053C]RKH15199.1 hypothetical protein D7V97_00880 [Corallococcus sp. CA053C]
MRWRSGRTPGVWRPRRPGPRRTPAERFDERARAAEANVQLLRRAVLGGPSPAASATEKDAADGPEQVS